MVEHEHEWGEWERILWYTPQGRFVGEARKCNKCPAVETRNVEIDPRPAVIQPTIGVFAAIYNKEGKIPLKKITTGRFAGEWDLLGGGVDANAASKSLDERIVNQELSRHVKEEGGMTIAVEPMPPMYPAVLKGGGDWAFVIPIIQYAEATPEGGLKKGEIKWVSPKEVEELAKVPEGERLLSGYGKRMHRLCLQALAHSPKEDFRIQAREMLAEIQGEWSK
jgi:hypothetical protein